MMNTLYQFLYQFLSRVGVCAVSGAIAGAVVGGLFGLVEFVGAHPTMPRLVLIGVAIGLSLFAWLVVLLIVGVFGNYGALTIAGRSLVTSLIVGILTVLLVYAIQAGLFGMLLGWIVGFLVGKMLCALCDLSQRRAA